MFIGSAYTSYCHDHPRKAPSKAEDLKADLEARSPAAYRGLKDGKYVFVYGVPVMEMYAGGAGTSAPIFAYEKDVPTKGGYVVMGAGTTVRQMTAAEFQRTPKATARKDPPALAEAPFGAAKAKEFQRAWAKYLGREVEEELNLGGGVKMAFVLIPPGFVNMGSAEAERERVLQEDRGAKREDLAGEEQHGVAITRPFYLGKYAVTRGQFRRFVGDAGCRTEAETDGRGGRGYNAASGRFEGPAWDLKTGEHRGGTRTAYSGKDAGFARTDAHPVVNVSWLDARAFCGWLSRRSGRKARLPSEAEWEYACRAGTVTRFFCGDEAERLAGYANVADGTLKKWLKGRYAEWSPIRAEDGYVFTAPVGSFGPNAFGMYDMHGNAWQWCADWYEPRVADLGGRDPLRADKGSYSAHVSRGGSWRHSPWGCRAALRLARAPRSDDAGFRVAFRVE
jgi:formylglycine-generating enzyme required for sulfatase activity